MLSPLLATPHCLRLDHAGGRAHVFVPLDIVGATPDQDNVRSAVAIHVGHLATGRGHAEMIQFFVAPGPAFTRIEDMRTGDLAFGAIAGDDIIAAVAIKISYADFVAFLERVVNHLTLPATLAVFGVDHNLVSVPWLYRGQDPLLAQMPDFEVARAQAWRFVAIVTFHDEFSIPRQIGAVTRCCVRDNALETGHLQLLPLVLRVPVHDPDSMDYAAIISRDRLTLPFA